MFDSKTSTGGFARASHAVFQMDYNDCTRCGFKCSSVCTVTRATRKHALHEFLERYLGHGEALAWPCMGCRSCEAVCPAEYKPYQLVQKAMQEFLKGNENELSDYHEEFKERGRMGITSVFLDDLVIPQNIIGRHSILNAFDKVIIFPGCLVSARFPWLVYRLYQLLVLLGVDTKRVIVEDESCCGSFLQSIDDDEFIDNGKRFFKAIMKKAEKTLILTCCGSCTSTLRNLQRRLSSTGVPEKMLDSLGAATIQHYIEFLAMPESIELLRPAIERSARVKDDNGKKHVYLQFPCQAILEPAARLATMDGLKWLLKAAGYEMIRVSHDLGCCGAGLLETHPDLAIEYGIRRLTNITSDSEKELGMIAVACGNCHRSFVDFKPAMEIESERVEGMDVDVRFLLDMLMELLLPVNK
ncbi:MAG: heterodisulfide reductase-related iron-sulfur binding cluster [Candidatus Sigynarchaeum springense]